VELSLSEAYVPRAEEPVESTLDRWSNAVADAAEACLVINADTVITALSPACAQVLGLTEDPIGRQLLDGVLRLLDFGHGGALTDAEVGKIPPLLALSSGQLARGLFRVVCDHGETATVDAIATPLRDESEIVGSLTFLSPISAH
jgi:PAS domain-containing protein